MALLARCGRVAASVGPTFRVRYAVPAGGAPSSSRSIPAVEAESGRPESTPYRHRAGPDPVRAERTEPGHVPTDRVDDVERAARCCVTVTAVTICVL